MSTLAHYLELKEWLDAFKKRTAITPEDLAEALAEAAPEIMEFMFYQDSE